MFFLLRMAFWLGIVLILLPSGTAQQTPAASEVAASDAISAASATVQDLRGFCTRQPDACTVGSQVATTLGYKAQAGAKMLYQFLSEAMAQHNMASHDAGSTGVHGGSIKAAFDRLDSKAADKTAASSQNTLTATDLAPAWHGPPLRRDRI